MIMYHLMPFPRHQALFSLIRHRFLSATGSSPAALTTGHYVKDHRNSSADASEAFEGLSRSQASGVWKSLQIINSTLGQIQNGSRSNLIAKYSAHKNQYLPSQAVLRIKDSFLDENQNLNGLISSVHEKIPDNLVYLAKQKSYLNKIQEGFLGYKIRNVLHLDQLFRPQILCSHNFHTASPLCCKTFIPFEPPKELLGLTYTSDLSHEDMEKIKKLAFEDLKTFLTSHNIPFTKVKSKKKASDHGIFGTPLEALVHKDKKKNLTTITKVPVPFILLVRYIEEKGLATQGIFQENGSQERIASLRANLENVYKIPDYKILLPDLTVHDVASTLVAFLSELPIKLVTNDRLEIFPDISDLSMQDQIKATNLFILSMNEEYRDTLMLLLKLMTSILEKKDVNKMNDSILATYLAPHVFSFPQQNFPELEFVKQLEYKNYFRLMINYGKKLSFVSHKLISQLRQEYESGALSKPKKRFKSTMKGKKTVIKPGELKSIMEVDLEIHTPERQQESFALVIGPQTTARDIVQLYNKDKKHVDPEVRSRLGGLLKRETDDYLYEVGGNIGERCLDPETRVLEVFRANPKAEWMIKSRRER